MDESFFSITKNAYTRSASQTYWINIRIPTKAEDRCPAPPLISSLLLVLGSGKRKSLAKAWERCKISIIFIVLVTYSETL